MICCIKSLFNKNLMLVCLLLLLPQAACSQSAAKEKPIPPAYTNPLGMEFVLIPEGTFMMGTPKPPAVPDNPATQRDESKDWMDLVNLDELPLHEVTISNDFYLGKYEVTQGDWKKVMNSNPSYFNEEKLETDPSRYPVENVSWLEIQDFIKKLNQMETSSTYRLPTEAEWEYASRADSREKFDLTTAVPLAWFDRNSAHKTHPVGSRKPNRLGLCDMLGNVWEWCSDWYDRGYYEKSPKSDPQGPETGFRKIMRGGSIYDSAELCQFSYRGSGIPDDKSNSMGFRLARIPKP